MEGEDAGGQRSEVQAVGSKKMAGENRRRAQQGAAAAGRRGQATQLRAAQGWDLSALQPKSSNKESLSAPSVSSVPARSEALAWCPDIHTVPLVRPGNVHPMSMTLRDRCAVAYVPGAARWHTWCVHGCVLP